MARGAIDVVPEAAAAGGAPSAAVRAKGRSLGTYPISKHARAELAEAEADPRLRRLRAQRPRTRGDCKDGPRPCPWAGCSMHLAYDILPESGALRENFPGLERMELAEPWPRKRKMVWVEPRRGGARGRFEYLTFSGPPRQHAVLDFGELAETCALDVADRGRHDLEVVGRLINLTMQRTAQHEESALAEARALAEAEGWAEHVAPERLYRIQRAPAQRRSERAADAAGAAEATRAFLARGGRWTGRAPYDPLCPRCGRQVPWERMAKHEAPDGRRCNEARVARAARADPSSSAL